MKKLLILTSLLISGSLWADEFRYGQIIIEEIGGKYYGEIMNELPHGQGVLTYYEGEKKITYKGEFKEMLFDGYGEVSFEDGSIISGQFKKHKLNGKCKSVVSNGNEYEGYCVNNAFHGEGIFTFYNDDKYIGDFRNGDMHGSGTYYWDNGDKLVGTFRNKKMSSGNIFLPDGEVYKLHNVNGELSIEFIENIKTKQRKKIRDTKQRREKITNLFLQILSIGVGVAIAKESPSYDYEVHQYRKKEEPRECKFMAPTRVRADGTVGLGRYVCRTIKN